MPYVLVDFSAEYGGELVTFTAGEWLADRHEMVCTHPAKLAQSSPRPPLEWVRGTHTRWAVLNHPRPIALRGVPDWTTSTATHSSPTTPRLSPPRTRVTAGTCMPGSRCSATARRSSNPQRSRRTEAV